MNKLKNHLTITCSKIFIIFIATASISANAELVEKIKYPLDISKKYQFISGKPFEYCTNDSGRNLICFTSVEDYKTLCKKTTKVDKDSVAYAATARKGGKILFENGGFKSLQIFWDEKTNKCKTQMHFSGMVNGTDMNYKVTGSIPHFKFTPDSGQIFGESYPDMDY
jgi:hypothetical protein